MSQNGYFSFGHINRAQAIQIAGLEVGTEQDSVAGTYDFTYGLGGSGVRTPQGFVHQSTTPSPKAPIQAAQPLTFALTFNPVLVGSTALHLEELPSAAEFGRILIWFPNPFPVTWQITAGRVQYSTPYFISGSAGERGIYVEPIVRVKDRGVFVTDVEFNAGAPGVDEFTLTSTTADTRALQLGDISAHDGLQLHAHIYCLMEFRILSFNDGIEMPGKWIATMGIAAAVSPVDYELDV